MGLKTFTILNLQQTLSLNCRASRRDHDVADVHGFAKRSSLSGHSMSAVANADAGLGG